MPRPARRLPRRTARLRLTVLIAGLFLVSGTILLTVTYLLVEQATDSGKRGILTQLAGSARPSSSRQISVPLGGGSPQQISAAQAAAVSRVIRAVLNQLLIQSPIALAIVTVAAVALGWVIAGRILRPLSTITAAARRISASNLNERLSLHGPDDELKALGDTSMTCSRALNPPSRPSGISSPTPHTNCAPRSPASAPCCKSRSTTPGPPQACGGTPPGKSSPPTPSRRASSRHCSPWPAAKEASKSASQSTSRQSPVRSWRHATPSHPGSGSTSRLAPGQRSLTATPSSSSD
ncbi:MAG: HAMP domain-containing protein [Nocardiopsaceae bacterium]|nr:HAMP domain-containing protein [Nocardiopsaceae bacterium]